MFANNAGNSDWQFPLLSDSSDAVPSPDGVPDIQGDAAASVVETTESNTDTMATDPTSLLPRVERRRRRQAPITPFQACHHYITVTS